ncbi:hypothetical protein K466DRAFT_225838 [Polyporus arcularius HHB13444]|uniref:Uncharacterized protein n=1 Tax=Polyporus arcularius HHB13444 TaxID=1314778 RepID=A0A5C3P5Z3_9APHY|nr:hypothetical protein K466DRAFT_225838 [Polyporus arcularius HHB13444]
MTPVPYDGHVPIVALPPPIDVPAPSPSLLRSTPSSSQVSIALRYFILVIYLAPTQYHYVWSRRLCSFLLHPLSVYLPPSATPFLRPHDYQGNSRNE